MTPTSAFSGASVHFLARYLGTLTSQTPVLARVQSTWVGLAPMEMDGVGAAGASADAAEVVAFEPTEVDIFFLRFVFIYFHFQLF
jgi:hypothetical protein